MGSFDQDILHWKAFLMGEEELPGVEAQYEMAPFGRKFYTSLPESFPDYRMSAVLLALHEIQGRTMGYLMQRTEYKGAHSKQIALPGGKLEPEDVSLEACALREFREELGVIAPIEVMGELTPVPIPVSRFLLHPFVGVIQEPHDLNPDSMEVAKVIRFPLDILLKEGIRKTREVDTFRGKLNDVPYFEIEGHVVWGATALVLAEVAAILQRIRT